MTRTVARALAAAGALTLLMAACSDTDDSAEVTDDTEETTTTAAEETTTTTEASEDETTTTEAEDEPTDPGEEGTDDGTEGDPEAIALAQEINLTIDDFADGWTHSPPDADDGGPKLDDCFVETDIDTVTLGKATSGTFALEQSAEELQLVTMQTVVLDSADSATAIAAEAEGEAFATCAADGLATGFGDGAEVTLALLPDEPPYTEQSFGLAGDVSIPDADGNPVFGAMDLHVFRTGDVVSFTATIDVGIEALESTIGELYPVVAQRHADAVR